MSEMRTVNRFDALAMSLMGGLSGRVRGKSDEVVNAGIMIDLEVRLTKIQIAFSSTINQSKYGVGC